MNKVGCGLRRCTGGEVNFVLGGCRDGIVGYGSTFKYGSCQIPLWFIGWVLLGCVYLRRLGCGYGTTDTTVWSLIMGIHIPVTVIEWL